MSTELEIMPTATANTTQAVAVRESGGAVSRALTMAELAENLRFVKQVMKEVMIEDSDYGKVPGCGPKPGLFQPGAQKLLMTFQLTDHVKKEEIENFPNYHRAYSFIISVRAPNGKEWDGVGTCSTLESKYRYRGGARLCPKCGKPTIIKGKADYGGGWICFGKKGGCGAKWEDGAKEIESQSEEKIEHDNPPDYYNTVRKMAFKRGLVHAAINATNTSELWSQDLEDLPQAGEFTPKEGTNGGKGATQHSPAATSMRPNAQSTAGGAKNASQGKPGPSTPAEDRPVFLNNLRQKLGAVEAEALFVQFLRQMPYGAGSDEMTLGEDKSLNDLDLMKLKQIVNHWADVVLPKFVAWQLERRKLTATPEAKPAEKPTADPAWAKPTDLQLEKTAAADKPRPLSVDAAAKDPEWFFEVIVPIPRKGMKKAEYMRNPDTIGSLWRARHSSQEATKRLFGFVGHFEPKPWVKDNGQVVQPSDADRTFRLALDAFAEWNEKHGKDKEPEQPGLYDQTSEQPGQFATDAAAAAADVEEDDVPF